MSMIERVARAIAEHNGHIDCSGHRGEARAAIAAMREPTPMMLVKGQHEPILIKQWQAMIDEALDDITWRSPDEVHPASPWPWKPDVS